MEIKTVPGRSACQCGCKNTKHLYSFPDHFTFSRAVYTLSEGEGPHPETDERFHDLQ